jgi:hypothetical protein
MDLDDPNKEDKEMMRKDKEKKKREVISTPYLSYPFFSFSFRFFFYTSVTQSTHMFQSSVTHRRYLIGPALRYSPHWKFMLSVARGTIPLTLTPLSYHLTAISNL